MTTHTTRDPIVPDPTGFERGILEAASTRELAGARHELIRVNTTSNAYLSFLVTLIDAILDERSTGPYRG